MSKAFFWQTPGVIAPFALGLLFDLGWAGSREFGDTDTQVRLLMGLGALPAAFVLAASVMKQQDSAAFIAAKQANPGNPLVTALKDRSQWRKLPWWTIR